MSKSILALVGGIIGFIVVLAGLRIYVDYQDAINTAFTRLENLARIADQQASGSLNTVNLLLEDVAHLSRSVASEGDAQRLRAYMTTRMAGLEELSTVYVTDAQGRVINATRDDLMGFDASQRRYYTDVLESPQNDRLFITGPLTAIVNNRTLLFVSRPIAPKPGAWQGAAVATLTTDYFTKILEQVVPNTGGFAGVVTKEGNIVSRTPHRDSSSGQTVKNADFTEFLASGAQSRHRIKPSIVDHTPTLIVYRTTSHPGLVVIIGQSQAEVLAVWYRNSLVTTASIILLLAISLFTVSRFAAHARRLRESQARLRLLFDANSDAIIVREVGPDGTLGCLEEVNATACRHFGYARDELLRLSPARIDAFQDGLPDAPALLASLRAKGMVVAESTHRCRDGRRIDVSVNSHLLELGGRPMILSVIRDITARTQAEQDLKIAQVNSQELFDLNQTIITESPFGILVYDEHGQCMMANQAAATIVGGRVDQVLGQNYHQIASWRNHGIYEAALSALALNQVQHHAAHPTSSFGRLRWLNYFFIPARIGGRQHLLLALDDITDQREAEAALRDAKEQAEAASAAKSQFLANMSHELRTPLNAIIGFSEILAGDEQDPKRIKYSTIITKSARELLRLIQDILDFSKIEAGRITPHPSDFLLTDKLTEILSLFEPDAHQKKNTLSLSVAPDLPAMLHGDPAILGQILTNLISNANKFTDHGRIELAAAPLGPIIADQPFTVAFTVTDTGIGIKPENQHRIFQSFVREDESLMARFGGTGLGLAIAQHLVALLQGEITVDSTPGQGSRFTVTAGFAPAQVRCADVEPPPGLRPPEPDRIRSILVAEDNEFNRELLVHILEDAGYHVETANDGAQALAKLAEKPFDLAVMDIRMPIMDGVTTCWKVQLGEVPGCPPNLPIIAVTAHALPGDRERFLEFGMAACLTKPIDQTELLATVRQFLPAQDVLEDG